MSLVFYRLLPGCCPQMWVVESWAGCSCSPNGLPAWPQHPGEYQPVSLTCLCCFPLNHRVSLAERQLMRAEAHPNLHRHH